MKRRDKRAQSFIEYALLIGVVVGALIAMKIYMTRSMQEKIRQTANVFGSGEQYEKGVTQVTDLDDAGIESPKEAKVTYDTCPKILRQARELETQLQGLLSKADSLEQAAIDTQAQIEGLRAQAVNMRSQADGFAAKARGYRERAMTFTVTADNYQAQIDQHKADCPECKELETEIAGLRQEAARLNSKAQELEDLAGQLQGAANTLDNETLPQLEEQTQRLKGQAEDFRGQADTDGAEIDTLKEDSPGCF